MCLPLAIKVQSLWETHDLILEKLFKKYNLLLILWLSI